MHTQRMSAVNRGGGNRFEPVIGRRVRRAAKAVLALLAATAMLVPGSAFAADGDQPAVEFNRLADENTSGMYAESLGDNNSNSTRYAGRVWNDKTVSSEDMTFTGQLSGGSATVEKGRSDFLVTYSVLATSQQVTKLPKVPVDVVFVLDFSASMTWGVDSTTVSRGDGSDSRINYMVDALNSTIDALVKDSDPEHPNRIGIVYFNRTGQTLLPLTELSETNVTGVQDRNDDGEPDYVSLSSFSGTPGQDNGKATVTCYIEHQRSANTDSKTNIQYGLYTGMSMLAEEPETTFTYEGEKYTRIPNVVLMSDGAPTTISFPRDVNGQGTEGNPYDGSWWEELDTTSQSDGVPDSSVAGDNNHAWSANGMMPMLTAQYLKAKIDAHYADAAADLDNADQAYSTMYTIGFSINQQTASMMELANMVLNPQNNWTDHRDQQCQDIVRQWRNYVNGRSALLQYPDSSDGSERGYFEAEHTGDRFDPNSLVPDYVDAYYPADDAAALENAFKEITNAITETAKVPTETNGGDPVRSGYITYTDPIGEYMYVDDVKTLIYAIQRFNRTGDTTVNGRTKTYVFTGTVNSPVYGNHNVSEIGITVTSDSAGNETLTVKIPASVIPIRVNEVDVKVDGTVVRNESNNAYPLRLVYGVSLNNNVIENGVVNTGVVSPDYIKDYSSGDGTVQFYTNLYSGATQMGVDGTSTTVGDATVTFEPADDNPFYYVQENIPLSVDGTFDEENGTLTGGRAATGDLDVNETYYFQISYYEGTQTKTRWVARPGSQLDGYVAPGVDGQLELQKGSPRLGNLTDLSRAKGQNENATGTAAQRLYPTFEPAGTSNPADGSFRIYLGNNGVLSVPTTQPVTIKAGQALAVVKRLHGNDLSANEADDNNFEFTLTPQATTSADGMTAVTADEAAEKLKKPSDTTDGDAADGILHFRNGDATKDDDGVATDTMHPITAGLTFTAADAGKTFTYEVAEVVPDPKPAGYIFDTTLMHTVTYTVALDNGRLTVTASVDNGPVMELPSSGGNQVPTVTFDNTYVAPVSALPLTGGDATARNLILAGGGILLLAGVAWLLARRRRV